MRSGYKRTVGQDKRVRLKETNHGPCTVPDI